VIFPQRVLLPDTRRDFPMRVLGGHQLPTPAVLLNRCLDDLLDYRR
jgi:hypothetical protein